MSKLREMINLAPSRPDVLASMHARLMQLQATTTSYPNPPNDLTAACSAMVHRYGGFFGPYVFDTEE